MADEPIDEYPPLEILYQDTRFVAINKPSGLLVHRSEIAAQEDRFALQVLRDQLGQRVYPVHRIDKPTSGILIFALDHEAMVALKRQFEACEIEKNYQVIVRGFSPESGLIEHPLRILNDFKGPNKRDESQEAETAFRTIARSELPFPTERYASSRYSLVTLQPKTGRRHQLRRHMDHINCPIIGDTRHGDNQLNKRFRERYGFIRLMLHAAAISFAHPFAKRSISITAPLPEDMEKTINLLQLHT